MGLERLVKFSNLGDRVALIPGGDDSGDLFLKRLLLIDYLSDPSEKHSTSAVATYLETIGVPSQVYRRWKRTKTFQSAILQRMRERVFSGDIMADAYLRLGELLNKDDLSDEVRARLVAKMATLDLKRLELLAKLESRNKLAGKPSGRRIEDLVKEASYKELPNKEEAPAETG